MPANLSNMFNRNKSKSSPLDDAMPVTPYGSLAAEELGLGGDLSKQVAGETEEERKKRMALLLQQQMLGPSGSPSVTALFGAGAGRSAGD